MLQNEENDDKIDLSDAMEGSEIDGDAGGYYEQPPRMSRITRLVIRCSGGLIKDEKGANYFLIGLSILAIMIAIILASSGSSNQPASGAVPAGQIVP